MAGQNDTTTQLTTGVGGDLMDETNATQADGQTRAKRPRVEMAIGGDGPLVTSGVPMPVELCENDRARFDRMIELLEKLVATSGGLP